MDDSNFINSVKILGELTMKAMNLFLLQSKENYFIIKIMQSQIATWLYSTFIWSSLVHHILNMFDS